MGVKSCLPQIGADNVLMLGDEVVHLVEGHGVHVVTRAVLQSAMSLSAR